LGAYRIQQRRGGSRLVDDHEIGGSGHRVSVHS